ncbi:efflux RND transporter periplasmic adaptor subunit [Hydrogenivirga sp. 128-5-R1-1]|uniref:efflux RND transporter periplasmic adaptor subunit n=1 Tax=Hydrogenivirga sp. 128-5-R1-1 TaxID=392423 RepID=UPI00015EF7F6|nr:efflux RND transporter periplasmic adaptor subunit [Hydrogenivirga sp. 128-5-R1-1]EDP75694.1 acriflavin resistance protein AcrE [Hydrogenivirga sp. 128-5-R1-1]
MRGFAKYFFFLFLPVLFIVLWLAGVFHPRLSAKEVEAESKVVEGIRAEEVRVMDRSFVSFAGTVVPSDRAEISTRTMGYVGYVGVKEGDHVRKGQLLLRIDPRDTKAQVEAARQRVVQAEKNYNAALAQYEATRKTYERFKKLLESKAVTPHEFDMVEAKYRAAKAQLEAARSGIELARQNLKAVSSNLSYTEVRAPFEGYVVSKLVDVGDIAKPGYPLLVLEKPPYKVEVSLPERFYGKVKEGDVLRVYIESLKRKTTAKVVELEPSVNPANRTFKVKAVLSDRSIKSGFFARVYVEEPIRKSILVPVKAVYKRWDFTGVWVVKPDNTLELRFVRLGKVVGDMVEVLSGLNEGERVVVEGLEKACDGCRVGG